MTVTEGCSSCICQILISTQKYILATIFRIFVSKKMLLFCIVRIACIFNNHIISPVDLGEGYAVFTPVLFNGRASLIFWFQILLTQTAFENGIFHLVKLD